MSPVRPTLIGYVIKMYPRFSETFILNEILAHEAAGQELAIFSMRAPTDGSFHESLARVRARVVYLPSGTPKAPDLWDLLRRAGSALPRRDAAMDALLAADVEDACQALDLALRAQVAGITHLHAHFASAATTVARLASLLTGIPYSFTAHAKDIFHEDVDADDLEAKLAGAAAVVTVSDFNLAYLRNAFGAGATRVVRVYNGLDLDAFPYTGPGDRPPVIVAVGRLVEKKGFGDLVEACALLVARGRRFRCRIVGAGPLEAELVNAIERRGLGETVDLLGPRPQSEVRAIVASAAGFAAPCVVGDDGNRDGLPTVLLEAMALGTPCIATDVTGIPEILHHETTGLAVPQHAPAALADAMERLLDDASLRARLATAARHLIERDFDVHRQAAAVRCCFEAPTLVAQAA